MLDPELSKLLRPQSVAIVGASAREGSTGLRLLRHLQMGGFAGPVYPINPRYPDILGIKCYPSLSDVPGPIDMASFYVPPEVGERVMDEVARKGIAEVWLNPGAESQRLIQRARALSIEPVVACSIVGIGQDPDAL